MHSCAKEEHLPTTNTSLLSAISYGAVPAGALAVGGAIAAYLPPPAKIRSSIQHIAAGFVFAAAGVEVLPDVMHRNLPLAAAFGFTVGVALMLTIRVVSQRFEAENNGVDGGKWGIVGVVVVDIFVDGLLIGVSVATDRGQGQQALLVAIALAAELLSLGLSVAAILGQNGISHVQTILITSTVALSPLIGAVAGYFLGGALTGGWLEGVLAFAVAALLYLAAEELLKEAHEVPETLVGTALFFGGFLTVLLIDMISTKSGGG